MRTPFVLCVLSLFSYLFWTGCTGTAGLSKDQRLYTGAKIKIHKVGQVGSTRLLSADLKTAITLPRTNKKLLWMRPRLMIHYMFLHHEKSSLKRFIYNEMGDEPIFYVNSIAARHQELLKERAANDGYFKIAVDTEKKIGKHTVKLIHHVTVSSARKRVGNLIYPSDSTAIPQMIASMRAKSLIKPGQFYQLEDLIAERQRLADTLRNNGWYFFTADNLLFEADTLHPSGELNLSIHVKKETENRQRQRYKISSITVYPDFDLAKQRKQGKQPTDTLEYNGINYVYQNLYVKPQALNRQISLKKDRYYTNTTNQSTIYRLLNLNYFKFINLRFDVSPQADSLLNAHLLLTPYRHQQVQASFSGVFSPSYYYGIQTGVAYTHRNLFKGAEALRVALNGAYLRTNKNNFDFENFIVSNASARLNLPRFLPLKEKRPNASSSSQISLQYETNWYNYNVPEYGRFNVSFQKISAEAGYVWKRQQNAAYVYELNPINVGFQFSPINNSAVRAALISKIPTDTTGTLISLLSFLEFKPNCSFTIDQRLEPDRWLTQYFHQRLAAQLSSYTDKQYLPEDYVLDSPRNLFLESDYRRYKKNRLRNVLATRMAFGSGIPLRKNGNIPVIDRYVIGGASSVRAFAPYTVGPGAVPQDTSAATIIVGSHTGNLLIEGSIEYRVPLGKYPELAAFLDAGNIWLTSGVDATNASKFHWNSFYTELAVGTGVGLRINLGFFVLRLDVAFPLVKPYLPMGERWVLDELQLFDKNWRRENLNWNFAFGYPF